MQVTSSQLPTCRINQPRIFLTCLDKTCSVNSRYLYWKNNGQTHADFRSGRKTLAVPEETQFAYIPDFDALTYHTLPANKRMAKPQIPITMIAFEPSLISTSPTISSPFFSWLAIRYFLYAHYASVHFMGSPLLPLPENFIKPSVWKNHVNPSAP